jgi:uncharacterized protein (DUF983 family)
MPDPIGPYDALDPPPVQEPRRDASPGITRALLRGIARRCPRCGTKDIFDGWFRMKERCPRCGLRFQREEGGFLGAMTLNYAVAMIVWIPVLIAGFVLTSPDPPVLTLTLVSAAVMIVVPLLFYPRSKATWAAIEFLVSETEPLEPDPRERFPSEGSTGDT